MMKQTAKLLVRKNAIKTDPGQKPQATAPCCHQYEGSQWCLSQKKKGGMCLPVRARFKLFPMAWMSPIMITQAPNRRSFYDYSGALSYSLNYDAERYFVSEILPLIQSKYPDATLTITVAPATLITRHL
jgi:hypothetical protein